MPRIPSSGRCLIGGRGALCYSQSVALCAEWRQVWLSPDTPQSTEEGLRSVHRAETRHKCDFIIPDNIRGWLTISGLQLGEDGFDGHGRIPPGEACLVWHFLFRSKQFVKQMKTRAMDIHVGEEVILRILPNLLRGCHHLGHLETTSYWGVGPGSGGVTNGLVSMRLYIAGSIALPTNDFLCTNSHVETRRILHYFVYL